jgi:hypothetical protein
MCICDAVPIRTKWLRYCIYAIVFTVLVSAIPMVLVLMVPIAVVAGCASVVGECVCDDYSSCGGCCALPVLICAINCGICCMPLGIMGALCTAPYFVCYGGFEVFKDYTYNIREAKYRA